MSGTFVGVEQQPCIKLVDAVSKEASGEADATLTEGAQPSATVLKENCVSNIDLDPRANVDDFKDKAIQVGEFSRDSYTAGLIVAQLGQMTDVSKQLRALNLELIDRINPSTKAHRYP